MNKNQSLLVQWIDYFRTSNFRLLKPVFNFITVVITVLMLFQIFFEAQKQHPKIM